MLGNLTERRGTVNDHGLLAEYAEAQRLAIEGNRLIAQEIVAGIRGLWRRVVH
jgi:hypothetical protein